MWNIKRNDTNEFTCKAETDSWTSRMSSWVLVGKDRGKGQGVWDGHIHTAIFKVENQPGPIVQNRELCLALCGSLDERRVWGGKFKMNF